MVDTYLSCSIPAITAVNEYRMSGDDFFDDLKRTVQNKSNVFEPFGILKRAYQELLAVVVVVIRSGRGRAETVAHRMNVLDVEKGELTRRVIFFVLVATALSVVGQRVPEWSCVENVQWFCC